jgi:hypothetical protein
MRAQAHPTLATLATRGSARAAMAIVATLWAGSLVVLGLWLVFSVAPMWSMFAVPAVLGGLTAVVMGQFVFASLIADRLFPGAARIIGWRLEIGSILLLLAAFAWAAWAALAPG